MTATNAIPTGTYAQKIPLLVLLTLLSGCSIYDFRQLVAPPNSALLIRQKEDSNKLSIRPSGDKFTRLNGTKFDPKQIAVTPSDSLAVETQNPSSSTTPSSSVTNAEQAQKTLIRYLALVEEQPERIEKLLNGAEQLAQRYPNDGVLQSLWQRLSRYSDWQPVNSIISSAGIDLISFTSWQPDSPFIRARRALLPPVADNEQIVFGDQRLVMLMVNENAVSLKAQARLEDIPFLPASPTTMLYQVDDLPPQQLALADKDDWKTIILAVPAGEHAVRFYQERAVGNQYIKLRFDESGSELAVTQERPYFISTAAQPLEFYSQGPSVLRIDELDQDNSTYRYQQVPEGWHTLRLPPPKGKSRSLLRVSQRVVNLHPKPINNRVVKRTLNPVAEPEVTPESPVISDKVELIDAYQLGKQEDGTLSTGIEFIRRNNVQESDPTNAEEQFKQYRLNYRYFDELHDAYWNTQGLFRIREHGGPTIGLEESVYYNPDWLPFNMRASAKVFAQMPNVQNNHLGFGNLLLPGSFQVPNDQPEALGQFNISISQAYNLNPKLRLIPSLSFFVRAMSLRSSKNSYEPNEIDQDIFTPYKANHPVGLSPSLTAEFRPWLDTVVSAKFSAQSNEDLFFNNSNNSEDHLIPYPFYGLFHADHFSHEQRWQQLLGSVTLDAFWRITFFQPDADRKQATERFYTGLELNWQRWTLYQDRIEISAKYGYTAQIISDRVTSDSHLATLSFTWHFGEGRGLRDFAPGEVDFRDIRQRQFTDGHNNIMHDVDDCSLPCPAP